MRHGSHRNDTVERQLELNDGEAVRQPPHLPEGWVQGTNLTMQERPLSTMSFPSLQPFPAETDLPYHTYTSPRNPQEGGPPKRSSKYSGPAARATARRDQAWSSG